MTLDHAILGFLDREPMTGYDLKTRCFDEAAGHLWTADQAQVYRTLDRLSKRGLVRSRLVPQRGKPDRRVFRITPKGHAELESWLHTSPPLKPLRDPLLVQLQLSSELADAEIIGVLSDARSSYQCRLETLRDETAAPPAEIVTDERSAELRRMTLAAAMSATRTAIDWIDDCMERIAAGLPVAAARTET